MEDDRKSRDLEDWLAPDFELKAEPDEKGDWSIVFFDESRDLVSAASPSGLIALMTEHPAMFKSDRHPGDHWLHKADPVAYGLLNAAIKTRVDPPHGPPVDAGETREATPTIDRDEAVEYVLPVVENMVFLAQTEGVGSARYVRRRIVRLAYEVTMEASFHRHERCYEAHLACRFAGNAAEQHPRELAYRAAYQAGIALIHDGVMDWADVLALATKIMGDR